MADERRVSKAKHEKQQRHNREHPEAIAKEIAERQEVETAHSIDIISALASVKSNPHCYTYKTKLHNKQGRYETSKIIVEYEISTARRKA